MASSEVQLGPVGLRIGEPIRFRRLAGRHWQVGTLRKIEADGSVSLFDSDGSARSHHPDSVMVRRPGGRGRLVWQVVSDVAITWEQLTLFVDDPSPADRSPTSR